MAEVRELNLLRDSNALMRQRETQRDADLKAAEEKRMDNIRSLAEEMYPRAHPPRSVSCSARTLARTHS